MIHYYMHYQLKPNLKYFFDLIKYCNKHQFYQQVNILQEVQHGNIT